MFSVLVMLVLVGVFIFIGYDVLSGKEDDIGPVDVAHSHALARGEWKTTALQSDVLPNERK